MLGIQPVALVLFFWLIFSRASGRKWLGAHGRALPIQLRLDRLKLQISLSSTRDLGLSCVINVPFPSDQYSGVPSFLNIPNFPSFLRRGICREIFLYMTKFVVRLYFLCFFLRIFCLWAEEKIALRKQESRETISLRKQWASKTHSVIHGNWRSDKHLLRDSFNIQNDKNCAMFSICE